MTNPDKVWDAMAARRTCMLVTQSGQDLHARPMAPVVEKEHGQVLFVTRSDTEKHDEAKADSGACLVFADERDNYYLSVAGRVEPFRDAGKLKEIWSGAMQAFMPEGPDDPHVEMLRFRPHSAEYWEGDSRIVTAVKMAASLATGAAARPGKSGTVRM